MAVWDFLLYYCPRRVEHFFVDNIRTFPEAKGTGGMQNSYSSRYGEYNCPVDCLLLSGLSVYVSNVCSHNIIYVIRVTGMCNTGKYKPIKF